MIYGSYAAMVYAVPGTGRDDRRSLSWPPQGDYLWCTVLLVVGHLGMAYEGPPAVMMGETVSRSVQHEQAFYLALSFIVVGVGFLKANISTIVGGLYGEGDPRAGWWFYHLLYGDQPWSRLWRPFCVLIWAKPYGWR